nr:hypothetical protein [Pedobacter sp. ASV2]
MKIKSAKSFREWYKNLTPARQHAAQNWDENFIGVQHNELSGFFSMYHGDKEQVYDFLRKEVEMAEDGQAIYEFVQNAADCNSTQFYMFYDEQHLVVINNGEVFVKEGIKSILNIGQSYGKQDPEKIGRYGIGFKLVHRLVGKSSGLDELLNVDKQGYRGPVLFSWSEKAQFENFLTANEFDYVDFNDDDATWLLKILVTNFPAQPSEKVKDINFEEIEPFQFDELKNFQSFLNKFRDKIALNLLESGTIFFLKLGEGKFNYLEKQKQEYLIGLSTSMHFLKSLDTLIINNEKVDKDKDAANILEFTVQNGSNEFSNIGLTEIRDKGSDAKFKICFANNANSASELKKHPNIYKFFPAVKEVNNLSFVIHCNLFELSSNRQNLTETPINKNLLSLLSELLKEKMGTLKSTERDTFKNLFISILMSEETSSNSGSGWQSEFFYEDLLSYISKNVPTKNNYSDNPQNVKINKTKQQLNLSDFGLNHFEWFEWDIEEDSLLLDEAKNKLDIEEWSLRDVFVNADLDCLNDWIKSLPEKGYNNFLKELDKEYFSKEAIERLLETDLFKFSNGKFYSINEVVKNDNLVFLSNKVINIQIELKSLDFLVSDLDISAFSFYDKVSSKLKSDEDLYDTISERTSTENNLTVNQKQNLFINFINPATKFNGIGDETLKKLEMFCDNQGKIKPVSQLVSSLLNSSSWLNPYKIMADEYFVQLNSYLIQEEDLFDKIILQNIEIIKDELTEAKEIKELVTFFKNKPRPFFNEYIIQKQTNAYKIIDKSNKFQIIPPKDERKTFIDFIETYLSDDLIVLPYDFSDFNDQDGILKGEKLHSQILALVDVDEHKETLVDFIHYNEPKRKLMQELTEFIFNSETTYTREDYEFKILDLACSELKENDYSTFRDKIKIQTEEQDLALSQIPSSADRVLIGTKELSQSQILPNEAKNGKVLSDLLEQFIPIGLQKEQLYKLFGIQSVNDPKQVFEILKQEYDVLENAQQLAFVLLYAKEFDENIENFKVEALDDKEWELKYNYYIKTFSFIGEDYLLKSQYSDVSKIINLPIAIFNTENIILHQPYFSENKFVCPSLKSHLSEEEKLALIDFLYSEWQKATNVQKIKNIDWVKINDIDTENIIGFNPNRSVFPNKYACESEVLPDYLIQWIGKDESKIDFLSDLGIWTENSVVVELRSFLKGNSKRFHNNRLAQETRFDSDETILFNTFKWLIESEIKLSNDEQYETLKKIKEIINDSRNNNDLIIQDDYDFEELEENSTEWENTKNYKIYLYDGEMPKYVGLNEVDDYIFYQYNKDNYAVNESIIYLNSKEDKKKTLQKVASDDENDFTFEDLWALFGESSDRELELEREIARLQQLVFKTDNATLGTDFSSDISQASQAEASREAKEIVKEKLEAEGFEFTKGIGSYSTIDGVISEGVEFPLVVKSYKSQNEPLKIGANEWIQLMRPNSMFWTYFGDGKLGCLKLYELLKGQDKLTISFSTENLDKLDRLRKFAELLHYFCNVHFDFSNVKPSDYSVAEDLSDYRFDERRNEEDLSSDDEKLL